jgi:hypothetical protein
MVRPRGRAHYAWADIPPPLVKQWTAEYRRRKQTIRDFAAMAAPAPRKVADVGEGHLILNQIALGVDAVAQSGERHRFHCRNALKNIGGDNFDNERPTTHAAANVTPEHW